MKEGILQLICGAPCISRPTLKLIVGLKKADLVAWRLMTSLVHRLALRFEKEGTQSISAEDFISFALSVCIGDNLRPLNVDEIVTTVEVSILPGEPSEVAPPTVILLAFL